MIVQFSQKLKETRFLNRSNLFTAVFLVLSIISYFFFDIPLAKYFHQHPPSFAAFSQEVTDLFDPILSTLLWPVLFFLFYFIWHKKLLGSRFLVLSISVSLTNVIVEILKRFFGRARPELLFAQNTYGFLFFEDMNPEFSFPSGHACTIGALIGAIACFDPKRSYLLLIIGLLLSFTRVILNYHFLSDVLIGYLLGILISQWIYKTIKLESTLFKLKN